MIGVMNLADYLLIADRKLLADAVGTIPAYLYQIATGRRKPSAQLARRIHEATQGAVTLESLRPDVWGGTQNGR
jgi:DNA-binding transcriptional regulator YdaS (Cro superfamily)